jgi:hypothetical protein
MAGWAIPALEIGYYFRLAPRNDNLSVFSFSQADIAVENGCDSGRDSNEDSEVMLAWDVFSSQDDIQYSEVPYSSQKRIPSGRT